MSPNPFRTGSSTGDQAVPALECATMTLLIACCLIYHFGLPWWLYPVAAVIWVCESLMKFIWWVS